MKKLSLQDTNIIKGAAMLLMIIYHCFSSKERLLGYDVSFLVPHEMYIANLCDICVTTFVFLSVFGICRSMPQGNPFHDKEYSKHYFIHRISKLYLMFWPVALICIAVTYLMGNYYYNNLDNGLGVFLRDWFCTYGLFFDQVTICGTWWYMAFAFLIVLLVPVYKFLNEKFDLLPIVLTIVLLILFKVTADTVTQQLAGIPLAMYCADHDVPERIRDWKIGKNQAVSEGLKILLFGILTCIFIVYGMDRSLSNGTRFFFQPFAGVFFVEFSYLTYVKIPVLKDILQFIGKYSMNMFLIHTFIRTRWLGDFTYGLGKDWLIFLWVLTSSLAISIAIEEVKKLIQYKQFEKWVEKKLENLLLKKAEAVA